VRLTRFAQPVNVKMMNQKVLVLMHRYFGCNEVIGEQM
jgi:hypothetical protein